MNDNIEIIKSLKLLEINYRLKLSDEDILFWVSMLQKYKIEDIQKSVIAHIEISPFFPKFSELKEQIDKLDITKQKYIGNELNPDYEYYHLYS